MYHIIALALVATAVATDVSAASKPWPCPIKAASVPAVAPLTLLANFFQDHMVLQRGNPGAMVWGFVATGAKVVVTFNGQQYAAVGDATGVWRVRLAPLGAGGPYTLEVSSGAATVSVTDILVGDVYLVGGQSNAQFTVASAFNATEEVAAANDYPNIRVFTVGQGTSSNVTLASFATIEQNWTVATNKSIGYGNWTAFSAIGWFFGRDVYNGLDGKVPIGLISDNWGGTPIQHWTSAAALSQCTTSKDSTLYNAMINPLVVGPLSLTGALWYQGEANAGQASYYECAFPVMIKDWRSQFANPNMWFGAVQLAPYITSAPGFAPLRQSQFSIFTLPNTALVVAADKGDATSPFGSVHPRAKQPIGSRLAASALAQVYGQNVPYLFPLPQNATGSTNGLTVTVTITFVQETVADGLQIIPGAMCPPQVPATECSGFVLQLDGPTGPWVNATASIGAGNTVVLTAQAPKEGSAPTLTQYGYNSWPLMSLYANNGLPAYPWSATVYPAA